MRKCLYCEKKIDILRDRTYCNQRCQQKDYQKKNRKRINFLMRKSYSKNKRKWKSRSKTHLLFNLIGSGCRIKRQCAICGLTRNLQIHHEIYPVTKKEIIEAVKNHKIYYLCRTHHLFVHSYRNTKNKHL